MSHPFNEDLISQNKIICSLNSTLSSEEKKPKQHSVKYSVEAEKKFPKIRISQKDYDRLKLIQQQNHLKSFGQVIICLLNCYKQQFTCKENEMYLQQ